MTNLNDRKSPAQLVRDMAERLEVVAYEIDRGMSGTADGEVVALGVIYLRRYSEDLDREEAARALRIEQAQPAARRSKPRAPSGASSSTEGCKRHKFVDGKCSVCGKPKGAGGRPAAPTAGPTSEALPGIVPPGYVAPRAPLGDAAADQFADGGLGSSRAQR
jgi:hypothetical protein